MSQHLKDRWGNKSRTFEEDDHKSETYGNNERMRRNQYRSRSRDRSRDKYRHRSGSRDRGWRSRESRSRSRSRSRDYTQHTRASRKLSPSPKRPETGLLPPRPPPLGLVPAPPPLGVLPPAPPPLSLVSRPTHSPSPSPPPSARTASNIKPTSLPHKGSKQFGIKLSLSNSASKSVQKAPKAAVSSVFNNESSDEEEEALSLRKNGKNEKKK